MHSAAVLAAVAVAVHLGVQWAVHLVVHPALAEAARTDDGGGLAAQLAHPPDGGGDRAGPRRDRAWLHARLRRVDLGRLLLAAAHLSVVLAVAVR